MELDRKRNACAAMVLASRARAIWGRAMTWSVRSAVIVWLVLMVVLALAAAFLA